MDTVNSKSSAKSSLVLVSLGLALASTVSGAPVRLNEIQVIGTHNSYHIQPAPPVMALIKSFSADLVKSLEYTHRPLPVQFDKLGIRQIELDIFADPQGGLYAEPRAIKLAAVQGQKASAPDDPQGIMRKPGFKVFHVQDLDFNSTALT